MKFIRQAMWNIVDSNSPPSKLSISVHTFEKMGRRHVASQSLHGCRLYYLTPNVTPCYTVEEVMKLSSWDKLLAKILTLSNDLRFEELRKVLEKFGYTMKAPRSGSSHYTFRKPGCQPITVPKHEPIKKVYVEMVRDVVESEMKNHEND